MPVLCGLDTVVSMEAIGVNKDPSRYFLFDDSLGNTQSYYSEDSQNKQEMIPKTATDSLTTLSIRTLVKNFALYFNNGYEEIVEYLPVHVKNRMLTLVTVSPRFWKDIDLNSILKVLCNKTTRHINLTTWLPNDDTLRIISVCENLESLYLTFGETSDNLTTEGLKALFPKLKNLRSIRLTSCRQANDEVVESIAENCLKLNTLDIGDCTEITDRALEALSKLEHLLSLRVYKTKVTEKGVDILVSGPCGPSLTELRVDDCEDLNQRVLITLTKKCPNLEVLTFHKRLSQEDSFLPDDLDMTQLKQVMYSIPW